MKKDDRKVILAIIAAVMATACLGLSVFFLKRDQDLAGAMNLLAMPVMVIISDKINQTTNEPRKK